MRVALVTTNEQKRLEIEHLCKDVLGIKAVQLKIDEIQGSIEEVAERKCLEAFRILKRPVMADDTGLCFHAARDLPGPYTKQFLNTIGDHGLCKMLSGFENNNVAVVTVIAYMDTQLDHPVLFTGKTDGTLGILNEKNNFISYDTSFIPEGYDVPYASMSLSLKNQISHRGQAIGKLLQYLQNRPSIIDETN